MLAKSHRLTWKDINYIIKKQQMVYWKTFSFFMVAQYPNKKFHQFSIQVPVKLSKNATTRNLIRRTIFNFLQQNNICNLAWQKGFFKIFIIYNKKNIEQLKEAIETMKKSDIKQLMLAEFFFSFTNLQKNLWGQLNNFSQTSSKA